VSPPDFYKKNVPKRALAAQLGVMALSRISERPSGLKSRYKSELEMAQAAARGDQNARRDLVSALLDQVRRTVSYLSSPNKDADDLAQLALIQILKSAGSFRGECTLNYWADRITVRTSMKQFRKRQRREKLAMSIWTDSPSDEPGLDDDLAKRQIRVHLSRVLQKISAERRAVIVLHHLQGYGISEISEMTGAPINTVRDRLRIGRKQLKKRILTDPSLKDWVGTGAK
jgi:RNA polymerase sigma-70 factor (ECF subfamily)